MLTVQLLQHGVALPELGPVAHLNRDARVRFIHLQAGAAAAAAAQHGFTEAVGGPMARFIGDDTEHGIHLQTKRCAMQGWPVRHNLISSSTQLSSTQRPVTWVTCHQSVQCSEQRPQQPLDRSTAPTTRSLSTHPLLPHLHREAVADVLHRQVLPDALQLVAGAAGPMILAALGPPPLDQLQGLREHLGRAHIGGAANSLGGQAAAQGERLAGLQGERLDQRACLPLDQLQCLGTRLKAGRHAPAVPTTKLQGERPTGSQLHNPQRWAHTPLVAGNPAAKPPITWAG